MSDHNHVHDENCNHDHEPQVLIFEDENGKEIEMILVQTFDVDNKEYAVFVERNNPEEDGLILRFEEEGDEVSLYQIEDEDEWNRVEAAFNKMVEEQQ